MTPFACIVADPPWSFGDKLPGPARGAEKHYSCLSVDQICGLRLPPIADAAILFLWRVAAMPDESLRVARAWGFVPKSEIVWAKTSASGSARIGMGRTVRNAHEVCIVATRGNYAPLITSHNEPSWFTARRRQHSQKPDEFYELVERLCQGPRLELFARRDRPGWTCIGDELGTSLEVAP